MGIGYWRFEKFKNTMRWQSDSSQFSKNNKTLLDVKRHSSSQGRVDFFAEDLNNLPENILNKK
jgi:hypothetical protein